MYCTKIRHCILALFTLVFLVGAQAPYSHAQPAPPPADIDPRLIEIVEEVRLRAIVSQSANPSQTRIKNTESDDADARVHSLIRIQDAGYSKNPTNIREAIREFEAIDQNGALPAIGRIRDLYLRHADLLERKASQREQLIDIASFEETGSWLERYFATQLSQQLYTEANERQAALQKVQYAFQLIPENETDQIYVKYAKADTLSTLSHLHNIQGNIDFAIADSLKYLKLTRGDEDSKSAIDILNNLIFSHTVSRDHKSQLYLSEQLLEIEKISTSSVPGLSEYRISQAQVMAGNLQTALDYATLAVQKSHHPQISSQAKINQAVALAGLGRKSEARALMSDSDVNLDREHLLNVEARRDVLYLGFLLAQGEDAPLARKLYNRQLDVTAQKFLANNSRDTTAMVAELENSRERQAERDAAAAREARLQAITIDRQRALNRTLVILSGFFGCAALASFLFMKFRVRIVGELEVKTIEAASAEKLKTEFLGMISHELRTPLNGIIGISDFLANYHKDPDIREKTGIVLKSGQELLTVVESLTDMARLDAGQLTLVPQDSDLSSSLAMVVEPWIEPARDKGLAFTHYVDPAITQHHIDEDRLIQCIDILLCNAVRFTGAGRVHLHITADQSGQNEVTGLTAIVADTGQGMSELVQSRLFTPFMQADTSRKRTHMGTGLNLAIAYALAEMMGGKLSVVSADGRGSEFTFKVPLIPAKGGDRHAALQLADEGSFAALLKTELDAQAQPQPESSFSDVPVLESSDAPQREFIDLMQPRAGQGNLHDTAPSADPAQSQTQVSAQLAAQPYAQGGLKGLVIDEFISSRNLLRTALAAQGHSCHEVEDGFTALKLLEQMPFDFVLLDIHMKPLEGFETLQRIRNSGQAYANIPIAVLTAENAASTHAACVEAGADLFLTKPVQPEDLLRTISYFQNANRAQVLSA